MDHNVGHGQGLNIGCQLTKFEYVMFLDVDTHFLHHHWHKFFIELMQEFDVIGGKGVPEKPIRPACMFMKQEYAKKYDWQATDGYQGHRKTPQGTDVAIKAYYEMIKDGVKIKLLEHIPNRYGTIVGEEFCINDKPLVYHHWSGTWLQERQKDFYDVDLFKEKDKLFSKIQWRIP